MTWPHDDWPMPSTTPPPSRLLGGVELHVMAHRRQGSEAARSATLLITFVDTPAAAKTIEMVLGSVDHVQHSSRLFSGPDGVTQVASFLRPNKFSTLDAVLLLARNRDIETASAQLVVQAIRTLADGLVIVVDENCPRWAGLRAVTGFVRVEHARSAFGAAWLARFLAALRTPLKFTGLDPDDIVQSLGGANEPALLVEAIYLGLDGKVSFANKPDSKIARDSTNVTTFVTATNMRLVGPATSALRATLSRDCAFTVQAPTVPALAPFLQGPLAMFQLICHVRHSLRCAAVKSSSEGVSTVQLMLTGLRWREMSETSYCIFAWS